MIKNFKQNWKYVYVVIWVINILNKKKNKMFLTSVL